jgi:hypothetical protein
MDEEASMRRATLAEAVERIQAGSPRDIVLAEFVDTFDLAGTDDEKFASIEREPRLTGDARIDALVGAMAEYLAKQRRLRRVPPWVCDPARRLDEPWFTTAPPSPARISDLQQSRRIFVTQYLHGGATFASRSRPLRRSNRSPA